MNATTSKKKVTPKKAETATAPTPSLEDHVRNPDRVWGDMLAELAGDHDVLDALLFALSGEPADEDWVTAALYRLSADMEAQADHGADTQDALYSAHHRIRAIVKVHAALQVALHATQKGAA